MLNIKTFVFNPLQENTYVVSDDSLECVIIDCGAFFPEERQAIVDYIKQEKLKPVHLLCTHGHFDHNFGIDTIFEHFSLKPEIMADDDFLISDLPKQFIEMMGIALNRKYPEVGHYFTKEEVVKFGSHTFTILPTPGHTPGGVSFYCAQEKALFSGDTLFRMSVGRTDFSRSSYNDLVASLQNVLAPLPSDTTVYCGHGPITTIGDELKYNPYMK